MFSSLVRFLRGRHNECDCCNHNIDIAALLDDENGSRERQTMKGRLKKILAPLKWRSAKLKHQTRKDTAKKAVRKHFKHVYKRIRRLGKKRSFASHRKQAPQTTAATMDTNEQADPLESAVRQLSITMFADIVENDRTLAKQTASTTQYFLVHLLSDLEPTGPFLSRYVHPSSQAFDMDVNLGLSFVSSWLQNSLGNIKTSYAQGGVDLKMPFCVLETTQRGADMRARALQRSNPGEKVGVATLDIAALQNEKLVASAEHTFDFLRVTRRDFRCGNKLLAWVDGGENDQSASTLQSAVLAVVEWEDTAERDSVESEEELRRAAQTPLPDDDKEEQWAKRADPPEKKDSGTVSRTASDSSKDEVARS